MTPVTVENRPGLQAIAYRVGTHATFKQSMLARLATHDHPALAVLRTREDDDFAIALLDAWALTGDVLTFYQERIATEAYLRTATEQLSVRELARLIGYQPGPGVAAQTYLALKLDTADGAPASVMLEPGLKVQSVPGPDEKPQTFETVEQVELHPEWNEMRPRLTQPQELSPEMTSLFIKGLGGEVRVGDYVLIAAENEEPVLNRVLAVHVDQDRKVTRLDFETTTQPAQLRGSAGGPGRLSDFDTRAVLNDSAIAAIGSSNWRAEDLSTLAYSQRWTTADLMTATAFVTSSASTTQVSATVGAFALQQRAGIYGHSAPKWESLPSSMTGDGNAFPTTWEDRTLEQEADAFGDRFVFLDHVDASLINGSWIALLAPDVNPQMCSVAANVEVSRADLFVTAKVSRLLVDADEFNAAFTIRATTVLGQSRTLELASETVTGSVENTRIVLDRLYLGLVSGRHVLVSGERIDLAGVKGSEVVALRDVHAENGLTVLEFEKPLQYQYDDETVTINANVVLATHGEMVRDVLGGGDPTQPFQRFALRQPPLTYIHAHTPSGRQSTLEIRVNDLLWHEVPTLYGRGPDERIYVTERREEDPPVAVFGDGMTGARLPRGADNVRARYRKGIGLVGRVKAGQLTTLLSRPLGIKDVTNPTPASGAEDPESLADARRNAPLTVLTLDRVVSLKDYEDYARAFPGLTKALATWTWQGWTRTVFLTIAGPDGDVPDATLIDDLTTALRSYGDPHVQFTVLPYRPATFRITAQVQVDPDYLVDKVLSAVTNNVSTVFAFETRQFAQPVEKSEVIAAIQSVPGVVAVDLDALYRSENPVDPNDRLPAALPDATHGAELLIADLQSGDVDSMT